MGIFKQHPKGSAIIVFVLFTLPSAINAYLSLYERFTGVYRPLLNLGFGVWLLPLIGGILAILIILQGRRGTEIPELEDIKTDLVNMNMYEREVALKKVQQACPKEIAVQIADDSKAVFGEDIVAFAKSIVQRVLSEKSVDAVVEFFKKFGDILDNNQYGLKVELEEHEMYKLSRIDLAQKRVKIKVGKRKGKIIQKNIDRVCSLSYGLNSSILLRGIFGNSPESKRLIPAEIRIRLEGVETAAEKLLNQMLNDLERKWKVTIKKDFEKGDYGLSDGG